MENKKNNNNLNDLLNDNSTCWHGLPLCQCDDCLSGLLKVEDDSKNNDKEKNNFKGCV